ncbi:MAG: hypothetical protein KKA55_02435 [Proteobacteria bacterium]|nr:hypothetical protein [Pseudomonadota bacterium]MBU1594377.1 hypothetical protein [Pseudomonadota bacterium]
MQASLIDMPKRDPFEDQVILKYSWGREAEHDSLDVEVYGRSLLGFGKIYKKINSQFLEASIDVRIVAEKDGSLEAIIKFLSSNDVIACATAMQILSYFGLDHRALRKLPAYILKLLIDIVRTAKGKKDKIKALITKLEIASTIKDMLVKLFENADFRASLDEMTAFLSHKGMESLTIAQIDCPESIIHRRDRFAFVAQPEDEVSVEYSEKLVSVTYLSPEKNRWQFKSKNFEFWATVTDLNFLDSMHGKSLENINDLRFIATVKRTTTKEANTKKTKTTREIYSFQPEQKQSSLLIS